MSDVPPAGGGPRRVPDPNALLGAGSRAYGWLRKLLTFYGTAVTVAQLVPAAVALVVVFVSPTAWLSATLRRWVGFGALAGTLLGVLILARVAGPRSLRLRASGGSARGQRLATVAWWGLGAAIVSAAAFRLHLAVVDVAFVQSVPLLTPVLDYYLGGGPRAAFVYNALAAALVAITLAGVVAGAPAGLLRLRERRAARRSLFEEGGPAAALDKALEALELAKAAVERSKDAVLRAADGSAAGDSAADASAADAPTPNAPAANASSAVDPRGTSATSEAVRPDLQAPRVTARRSPH